MHKIKSGKQKFFLGIFRLGMTKLVSILFQTPCRDHVNTLTGHCLHHSASLKIVPFQILLFPQEKVHSTN